MKKELKERVQLLLPEGDCWLEYYLCEDTVLRLSPHLQLTAYGVEVVKRCCDTGELLESKMISDVCGSQGRMIGMIERMAQNTVTPVSLRDVIEVLLAESEIYLAEAN